MPFSRIPEVVRGSYLGIKKTMLKKSLCQPHPLRGRKLAPKNVFQEKPRNHKVAPQQRTLFENITDFIISKAS